MSNPSKNYYSRHKPDIRPFLHVLALLMLILSFAFTIVTAVGIGGLSKEITAGQASKVPWILTVNQTATSTEDLDGSATGFSLRRWGFGPWGWCEWTYSPDTMQDTAKCIRSSGIWQIPRDAPSGDAVLKLDLPSEIARTLPGVSVLLIPSSIIGGVWMVLVSISLVNPGASKQNPNGPSIAYKEGWQGKLSYRLRGWLGLALWSGVATFNLIPLIVAGIGITQLQHELEGKPGFGGYLLIGAVLTATMGHMFAWWWTKGGLRVRKTTKGGA